MHKRLLNQAVLEFSITPRGPLLIKSGREAGADPTLLDMNFVRIYHAGLGTETVYLPGSSLKGTLRSYAERAARTLGVRCCNPFDNTFCGRRLDKVTSAAERHKRACTACRLFGNTALASRLRIADAYPTPETLAAANRTWQRDGVAIDRISGAVAVGPFNLEVVTQGVFRTTLAVDNFQLWQLGLLAIMLRDLGQGLVPIGFGKSRGLGQVAVTLEQVAVSYPGRFEPVGGGRDFGRHLYGVGAFDFEGQGEYGFVSEEPLALAEPLPALSESGEYGRVVLIFQGEATQALLRRTVSYWRDYVHEPAAREEG